MVRDQLSCKRVEAFLATVERWSRWQDCRKKIDWPLFPGYCFVRFSLEFRLRVLKCSGVVSIVSFNGDPATIRAREIENIRRLIATDLRYDPCPLLSEGTMIEVEHGPLKGVVGRLIWKGRHARLILAVKLIG